MADPVKCTSADIRNALRLRYPTQSHALLFEVANGTGSDGKVYADAVAYGLWPSHGFTLEGIEIKVSRGDFLREMQQPGKSEPVMRFCHRWWLATPAGLVKPDELPPTWGLLELRANGNLYATKKPTTLKPQPATPSFVASLLRRHAGRDEDMMAGAVERAVKQRTEELEASVQRRIDAGLGSRHDAADKAAKVLQRLRDEFGLDVSEWSAEYSLLPAIRFALNLRGRVGALDELAKAAERLVEAHKQLKLEEEPTT